MGGLAARQPGLCWGPNRQQQLMAARPCADLLVCRCHSVRQRLGLWRNEHLQSNLQLTRSGSMGLVVDSTRVAAPSSAPAAATANKEAPAAQPPDWVLLGVEDIKPALLGTAVCRFWPEGEMWCIGYVREVRRTAAD